MVEDTKETRVSTSEPKVAPLTTLATHSGEIEELPDPVAEGST